MMVWTDAAGIDSYSFLAPSGESVVTDAFEWRPVSRDRVCRREIRRQDVGMLPARVATSLENEHTVCGPDPIEPMLSAASYPPLHKRKDRPPAMLVMSARSNARATRPQRIRVIG